MQPAEQNRQLLEHAQFAVEFKGVTKSFGSVIANDDVSFGIHQGEIHGIVGENGAGKSTLMSALFGLYKVDKGEIWLNGRPNDIRDPKTAINSGIGMVHQHFMLIDRLTSLQNVVLGAENGFWLKNGTGDVRGRVEDIQKQYGLHFPLDELTRDLPVGVQQRIEILKALYRGAEVLILDEPTSVLTPNEVDQLFGVFRDLKERGKTVVLITHKLQEIIEVTDTVSVLKQGTCVGTYPTSEMTRTSLAEKMVGRSLASTKSVRPAAGAKAVVSVRNLVLTDKDGIDRVSDLSFDIHDGELLGIAGVSGNGQSELLEAMTGLQTIASGKIVMGRTTITADTPVSAASIRAAGVGHVPEDRHRFGMISTWATSDNSILGLPRAMLGGGWRLSRKKTDDWCASLMALHDVRPAEVSRRLGMYSGGNQQKLVIGRELAPSPEVLLIGQPTRGVDIGAMEAIHEAILAERDKGRSVLVISVELEEILKLSDRIMVMFEGRNMGIVNREDASESLLGMMMAGLTLDEARNELARKDGEP